MKRDWGAVCDARDQACRTYASIHRLIAVERVSRVQLWDFGHIRVQSNAAVSAAASQICSCRYTGDRTHARKALAADEVHQAGVGDAERRAIDGKSRCAAVGK
jgi:hypothetical protein